MYIKRQLENKRIVEKSLNGEDNLGRLTACRTMLFPGKTRCANN